MKSHLEKMQTKILRACHMRVHNSVQRRVNQRIAASRFVSDGVLHVFDPVDRIVQNVLQDALVEEVSVARPRSRDGVMGRWRYSDKRLAALYSGGFGEVRLTGP